MTYRQADEVRRVPVHGYEVATYSFGVGKEVLFCLNGGPGLPCDYVRDAHSRLAGDKYRVVCFDQLGCGASDRPDDDSLWTLARYVEEVEIVRTAGGGPTYVTVRDHARGLDADGLEKCFGTLGGRSSGFEEGREVRGNLGRGAKDTAAFGTARFEAIRDGIGSLTPWEAS